MILPTAAATALAALAVAGHTALHHHQNTLLAEFENDLDQVDPAAHRDVVRLYKGAHRGGHRPGTPEHAAFTRTQRIPPEVLREVLAGPKEHR